MEKRSLALSTSRSLWLFLLLHAPCYISTGSPCI